MVNFPSNSTFPSNPTFPSIYTFPEAPTYPTVTNYPTPATFHPDTLNWRDRAVARGGIVEDIDLVKLNPFVETIYQEGLRDSVGNNHIIIELIPLMGANLEAALTRLWLHPNAAPAINNGFVEGDYTRSRGLTSGVFTFLQSGIQPSLHLNFSSLSVGLYNEASKPSASNEVIADDNMDGNQRLLIHSHFSDNNIYFDVGNAFAGRTVAATGGDSQGLIVGSKLSATECAIYRRGIQIGSSATEGGVLPLQNLKYFKCNSNDPGFTKTFGLIFVGKGIPSAKQSAFNTAVHNLMTSLGRAT